MKKFKRISIYGRSLTWCHPGLYCLLLPKGVKTRQKLKESIGEGVEDLKQEYKKHFP